MTVLSERPRIMISPLARRVARAHGMDPADLQKRPGRRRIVHDDVLAALARRRLATKSPPVGMVDGSVEADASIQLRVECAIGAVLSLCAEIYRAMASGGVNRPRVVSPDAVIAKAWARALAQTGITDGHAGLRIRVHDLDDERAFTVAAAGQCAVSEIERAMRGGPPLGPDEDDAGTMPALWVIAVPMVEVARLPVRTNSAVAVVSSLTDAQRDNAGMLRVQMMFETASMGEALRAAATFRQLVERPLSLLA